MVNIGKNHTHFRAKRKEPDRRPSDLTAFTGQFPAIMVDHSQDFG
jgi:hypothetical protein